ncbi:MAG: GNAT family N-acetyltransferase [Actinomycetota bacterium]
MARVRTLETDELRPREATLLRELVDAAWANKGATFSDDDWESATGGVHFLLEEDDLIVAHASIVERELRTGDRRLATGYVEAVGTLPTHQHRGSATQVMREVARYLDRRFELGALDTGNTGFYERLGWRLWRGPNSVRTERGLVCSDDHTFVLVHLTPRSPALDTSAPIGGGRRLGDAS